MAEQQNWLISMVAIIFRSIVEDATKFSASTFGMSQKITTIKRNSVNDWRIMWQFLTTVPTKCYVMMRQYNLQMPLLLATIVFVIFTFFLLIDAISSIFQQRHGELERSTSLYANKCDITSIVDTTTSCIVRPENNGHTYSLTSVSLAKLAPVKLSSQCIVETHLSTPPRISRLKNMECDEGISGGEREADMARFTNLTGVSTLTPDSGFREIAWRMELNDESSTDNLGSISTSSLDSSQQGLNEGTRKYSPVLQKSVADPSVLIRWRVFVDKYGFGTIVGMKRKKFTTTKFEVQFDNGQSHKLALKRSSSKGKVPFTLIKKIG